MQTYFWLVIFTIFVIMVLAEPMDR